MNKSLPWVKLHERWFTCTQHVDLGPIALNIGPRLMSLANASPKRGALIGAGGHALSLDVIAQATRFSVSEVSAAMTQLAERGSLTRDAAGVWSFPGFMDWQEAPSSKRSRQSRARKAAASPTKEECSAAATPSQRRSSVAAATEVRGQRSEDHTTEERGPEPEGTLGTGGRPPPEPSVLFPDPVVMKLPLQAGKTYEVTESQLAAWARDFPGVDVRAELGKLRARWDADPRTRPRTRAKVEVVKWLTHAANFAARDVMRKADRAGPRRVGLAEQQLMDAHALAEREREVDRGEPDRRLSGPRGGIS